MPAKFDTHEISNRPYEDCCTIFTPSSPKTKPKREKINRYEQFYDFETLIQEAVNNVETLEMTASSAQYRRQRRRFVLKGKFHKITKKIMYDAMCFDTIYIQQGGENTWQTQTN